MVCQNSTKLPDEVRDHCNEYNIYKKHANRRSLDEVSERLTFVADQLNNSYGYTLVSPKSPSILRALRFAVELRNKSAHGALKITFLNRIEGPLFGALRQLLTIIPFSAFTFRGRYGGSNAMCFIERGSFERRGRDAHFWADSELLQQGFSSDIPFLSYREDSQTVYFLNSSVVGRLAEYIDYSTGSVTRNEIKAASRVRHRGRTDVLRPRNYEFHLRVLSEIELSWARVPLSQTYASNVDQTVGVYTFVTTVRFGKKELEVILYVGKTVNLKDRINHYLRIWRGYETSRPEIAAMFETYGDSLTMKFAEIDAGRISNVERAIYETTMPEYNLIAPPAALPEGDDE